MYSAIQTTLIVFTLGLCAVAVMGLWLEDPKNQILIKAVLLVLIGVAFGVMMSLTTIGKLLGCR